MAYVGHYHYCDRCNSRYEPNFTKYVPVYNYGLCLNCANVVLATIEQDEETPQPQTTHEKEYQTQAARVAELEAALREIEQNAGQCVTLEQANWTIERIKQRAAAALK